VSDQTGSGERVVLIFGDQMPGEHGELVGVATSAVWKPRRAWIR
jgi:hypothetical protein